MAALCASTLDDTNEFEQFSRFSDTILYWICSMNPQIFVDFCIVIMNKINDKNYLPFAIDDLFMEDNGNDDRIENEY